MSVKELYEKAKELGIENEAVEDAAIFIQLHGNDEKRKKALCGYCEHRDKEECPWPNMATIHMPACLSYKQRKS